jgi:leader peptidase (prepilin peptidase) / N-methyltransferase
VTALAAVLVGLLGLVAGAVVSRAASRFPWPARGRAGAVVTERGRGAHAPAVVVGTGLLFALTALRFGLSAELPAFLYLAAAGVLLAVIDLGHRLLPDRVVLPSLGIGIVLLAVAALAGGAPGALLRAVVAAAVLFVVFLVMALIAPSSLGMGDVKLAALLGLYLGWLGWNAVLFGAAAGFVVQALLALVLLATRRIGLRGELPFGPALLLGAALVIGWSGAMTAPGLLPR